MIEMGDDRHWFERFTSHMENNIKGVQYGVYGVGLLGLTIALRSVRPFQKFRRPLDIPPQFASNHMTLQGRVARVEPTLGKIGPLLLLDHFPVIGSSLRKPGELPVEISSVDVSPNGLSWLQHIVVGKHISFTLLRLSQPCVTAIVRMEGRDLGVQLVSLGLATVSPLDFRLDSDRLYLRYYQSLLKAESKAEKWGVGVWWGEPVPLSTRLWRAVVGKMWRRKLHML